MKKRDRLVRYSAPERINHWIVAFCFVLAALSGLGFFFPSFNWLMHVLGTPQLARILHPFVGTVMFAAFIIMFLRYWKHNLINREDLVWAKNIHNRAKRRGRRYRQIQLRAEVCVLGCYHQLSLAAGERNCYLAPVLCRCLYYSADSHRASGAFGLSCGADRGDYGAHLRRLVGKRHHYRHG